VDACAARESTAWQFFYTLTGGWRRTARILHEVVSDLARIQQTLDDVASGGDAAQIISGAANELTHVITRTRRFAEQCATEDAAASATT
jgi:hypothetical protein